MTTTVYPNQRRRTFGEYLTRFYRDRQLWPPELEAWYEKVYARQTPAEQGRGLTVELLLEWMAEHTGMSQLVSPEYKSTFISLLGSWGRWRNTPKRGGDSFPLMAAIADCGIIRDSEGEPITDTILLANYLFGIENQPSDSVNDH